MTFADSQVVITTTDGLVDMASRGIVAPWLGAAKDDDGFLWVTRMGSRSIESIEIPFGKNLAQLVIDKSVILPVRAIAWSDFTGVVLQSSDLVREFSSRAYDNFDPKSILIVSEDLFIPSAIATDQLTLFSSETLISAKISNSEPPYEYEIVDSIVGALACVSATPLAQSDLPLRDSIIRGIASNLVSHDFGVIPFHDSLLPLMSKEMGDFDLMGVILHQISSFEPSSPIGVRSFVNSVSSEVSQPSANVSIGLNAVNEVLAAQRALPSLDSSVGLSSIKALLLFCLRPDPIDAVEWAREMKSDPKSVIAASALSGFRSGWSRLNWRLRGPDSYRGHMEKLLLNSITSHSSAELDLNNLTGWAKETQS